MINKNVINEGMRMYGGYIFQAIDIDTGEVVAEWSKKNLLMKINRDYRQAMIDGSYGTKGYAIEDLEIKYIALGTGTTAATENDTQLETETFRKQFTSINTSGDNTTTVLSLGPAEANFTIKEIGVFCGPAAAITPNSGNMISRVNVDFEKTANIRFNIIRVDGTVLTSS